MNIKIQCFNQVVLELLRWWEQVNSNKDNDLGHGKLLRLLFFVCGVDKENHLFDVFDKFQAWQYGQTEIDIFNYMRETKQFNRFSLDFENTEIILSPRLKLKITNNIKLLRSENPKLVNYSEFRLSDISHQHWSWRLYFENENLRYTEIEKNILIHEPKYFI